jgi:hypothetical protein
MSIKNSIKDGTGSNLEAKVDHTSVTNEEALWVNMAGVSPSVTLPVFIGPVKGGFEIDQKASLNGAGVTFDMSVDGSITAQEFRLEADPEFDLIVTRILMSGTDGGVKMQNWFAENSALTNGVLLSLKQNNITLNYEAFTTTASLVEFATEGGDSLYSEQSSSFVKASKKFEVPYIIRKQGVFGTGVVW